MACGPIEVFRRVILPLTLPGLANGWMLTFISSFDEVTTTVIIASPSTITLPVRFFLYIQDNFDPLVASVSGSQIFVTLLVMLVIDRVYGIERLLVGRGQ